MRSRGWCTAAFSLSAMARLLRLTSLVFSMLLFGSWAGAASVATFFSDLPSDALPENAFPGDGGCMPIASPYGELFGMACGIESVSFTLHSPEGWAVDREEGKRLRSRVVYTAGADTAAGAGALLYAGVSRAEGGQWEEAARAAAEKTLRDMRQGNARSAAALREAESYTVHGDLRFAVRFFDKAPAPWAYRAVAYLPHEGAVFSLTLAARDEAGREAALPAFTKALQGVMINGAARNTGEAPAASAAAGEVRRSAWFSYAWGLVAVLVLLGFLRLRKARLGNDRIAASREREATISADEYMTAVSGAEVAFPLTEGAAVSGNDEETAVFGAEGAFLITEGTAVSINENGYDSLEIDEFWVQQKKGEALHVNLGEYSVPVRIGDEVLMISTKGNTIPCYIYIKNTESMYKIYEEVDMLPKMSGCLSRLLFFGITLGWALSVFSILKKTNMRLEYAIVLFISVPVLMCIYSEVQERKKRKRNTATIDFFIDYIESTGIDIKTSDKFTFRMPVE